VNTATRISPNHRGECLALMILVSMSACTTSQTVDINIWEQNTRPIYDTIRIIPGTDADPPMLAQDMPPVAITQPYQTALSLTDLGPDAQGQMSADDWATVTGRLRRAAEDGSLITGPNSAPVAYTVWEMAWVDHMNDVFTQAQRDSLLQTANNTDLLGAVNADSPDVFDVYVAVSAYRMLGGLTNSVQTKASDLLEKMTMACRSTDVNGHLTTLAMAAMNPVNSPCTSEETDAAWQATAAGLLAMTHGATRLDTSLDTMSLLLLEESRVVLWPDELDRSKTVKTALANIAIASANPDTQPWIFSCLQKAAFLIGETVRLADQQQHSSIMMAVFGSTPNEDQLRDTNIVMGLAAARAVGSTVSLPAEFVASLDPLNSLAAAYGRGDSLDSQMEQWIADIATQSSTAPPDQSTVLSVIAPILLTAPSTEACSSTGVNVVRSALADNGGLHLQPSTAALGIRVLERCGQSVPRSWRDQSLGNAKALESAGSHGELSFIWEATRVLCALEPDAARVGAQAWNYLQEYVYPEGGAIGPDGFVSLRSTYQLLSIVTTTKQECRDTGLLEARSK